MRTILLFLFLASPAAAQQIVQPPVVGNCYAYPLVVAALAFYGEKSVAGPDLIEQTGSALEVFISKRGSITLVEVMPSGLTCYRAFNGGALEMGAGWGAPAKNMSPL